VKIDSNEGELFSAKRFNIMGDEQTRPAILLSQFPLNKYIEIIKNAIESPPHLIHVMMCNFHNKDISAVVFNPE